MKTCIYLPQTLRSRTGFSASLTVTVFFIIVLNVFLLVIALFSHHPSCDSDLSQHMKSLWYSFNLTCIVTFASNAGTLNLVS